MLFQKSFELLAVGCERPADQGRVFWLKQGRPPPRLATGEIGPQCGFIASGTTFETIFCRSEKNNCWHGVVVVGKCLAQTFLPAARVVWFAPQPQNPRLIQGVTHHLLSVPGPGHCYWPRERRVGISQRTFIVSTQFLPGFTSILGRQIASPTAAGL